MTSDDATDPWRWDAATTAARVRSGAVTAADVVRSHLARLDAVNPALNAVTRRDDAAALAAAEAVDDDRRAGRPLGPLAGVPVTIKDSTDVAGQSSPNGVPALDAVVASDDAPLVGHLRRAGAVIIGRSNAPEFSWRWHTDNPLFGPTRNPWDPTVTPGGSSGGAAAAVAAGIGALAHGSDAGGSLRWPAMCCGAVTLRPTQHRVPAHNVTAGAERSPAIDAMAVHGVIARRVADVQLTMPVLVQPSWRDPAHVPVPFGPPPGPGRARRAGVCLDIGVPLHDAVAGAVAEAADRLRRAGWQVEPVAAPGLVEAARNWERWLATDFALTSGPTFRRLGSPALHPMLDVLAERAGPVLDLAGYLDLLAARAALVRRWQQLLTESVDVLLLPVCAEPPWPAGDDLTGSDRLAQLFDANTPLVAVNFLGLPAAALPTGLHRGVPVGVQLVAARFADATALDAAAAVESGGDRFDELLWARPQPAGPAGG
jgi:amidase